MSTALITHHDFFDHVTPPGHPEQVARLDSVYGALEDLDLTRVVAPLAAEADLLRVHPKAYLDRIADAIPEKGIRALDADTHVSPGSLGAAWRGAGAVLRGVDMVLSGEVGNAFAAVRPPGHHAETETPMGFCLFGNVAAAAKYALDHHGLSRVAVVDFDVHHGNGTQDLLWDEARTLFVSSHQMPLWPGTGRPDETGAHDNVLNLALPPESDGAHMRRVYEAEVFPRLHAFAPELLLISAGFDAHHADPLAQLNWEVEDFVWLTGALCDIADESCGGRVVSALEGGYDLEALGLCVAAHVNVLMERAR
ncbi:histone deacetylase family protein [Salibaculum griseiflavum]|uniref:Acetoin utilization protein n=1 Tax=Salibaculum griseiflavum TaxID=1914409 RepID=A0A2V1P3X3_9RHOB|nr:histone deacetylase family protein [Salibaculum griseiflavum]PWG16460.1 acetoin utilization protein [Salibaculum griseiflavum]